MKMKVMTLALLGVAVMSVAASAQVVVYQRHGKHSSFGIGLSLGHSHHSYYQPSHYYAPAPVTTYYTPPSYYYPAYGYHAHHVESHVTPYSGSSTQYNHFGPVHAPSQATTYYGYPSPYGYSTQSYYWHH